MQNTTQPCGACSKLTIFASFLLRQVTGGQDDLVGIWSFEEQDLLARAQSHQSWIMDVAFDTYESDANNYRFGSVGQDGLLLLWDFTDSSGTGRRSRSASLCVTLPCKQRQLARLPKRGVCLVSLASPHATRTPARIVYS